MEFAFNNKSFYKYSSKNELDEALKRNKSMLFYDRDKKVWLSQEEDLVPPEECVKIKENFEVFNERVWILLKRIDNSFKQEGPFSCKEIFEKFLGSSLKSKDCIWTSHYKKWKSISSVETFMFLFESHSQPYEEGIHSEEREEILSSVVEQKRASKILDFEETEKLSEDYFVILKN